MFSMQKEQEKCTLLHVIVEPLKPNIFHIHQPSNIINQVIRIFLQSSIVGWKGASEL